MLARNLPCVIGLWLLAGALNAATVTISEDTSPDAKVTAEEPATQVPEEIQGVAKHNVTASSQEPVTVVSMEEVQVTAKHPMRNDRDFPGTASVIDTENIERRLMRTIKDIVRYEPNVRIWPETTS